MVLLEPPPELELDVVASGSPPESPHAAVARRAAAVAMVRVILVSFTVPLLLVIKGFEDQPYVSTRECLHQGGYYLGYGSVTADGSHGRVRRHDRSGPATRHSAAPRRAAGRPRGPGRPRGVRRRPSGGSRGSSGRR